MLRSLKAPAILALPVVMIPFAIYVLTMPTSITLEDAGLFQMVCTQGGLSHPPGYPLFTILCQNLLFSDDILAGNLLSAFFGTLALLVFYLLLTHWFSPAIAAACAMAYGFSLTFWQQAIIIEVYTLASLLFFMNWLLLERFTKNREWRCWYLACFVFGLALSNHWPLMLLATPALATVAWPVIRHDFGSLVQPGRLTPAIACFTIGLMPYSSLLLADQNAFGVFGPVTSPDEFMEYITRALYDDQHAAAGWDDKWQYLGWLAPEAFRQLGLPLGVAALAGLALMIRDRHRLLAPTILAFLGATLGLALLLGFEYDAHGQSIFRPYPIIAWALPVIWLGYLLNAVTGRLKHLALEAAILVCVIVFVTLSNFQHANRSHKQWVENYFIELLDALPENAILFTDGDLLSFPLGYLHFAKDQRPDITLLNWSSLTYPNRLTPARATRSEKEAAIIEFVTEATRPVFVIEPTLAPLTRYGWFNEVNRIPPVTAMITPEAENALDPVLALHLGLGLRHQQEYELADFILASYTRLYISYQQAGGTLNELQDTRFRALLGTFPGKMILMAYELDNNPAPDKAFLSQVLEETQKQQPTYITRQNQRRLQSFANRILALD
jgi:hypothetical protein